MLQPQCTFVTNCSKVIGNTLSSSFVVASCFGMLDENESQPRDSPSGMEPDRVYVGAENSQLCLGGVWRSQP